MDAWFRRRLDEDIERAVKPIKIGLAAHVAMDKLDAFRNQAAKVGFGPPAAQVIKRQHGVLGGAAPEMSCERAADKSRTSGY